jgi:hypothetical protein
MIDQLQAANVLFPAEAAAEAAKAPAARPTPVAQPAAAPAAAPAEETYEQKVDRLDKAMGLGKYAPGPDGKTPADAEAKPTADAKPEGVPAADIAAAEKMLDMQHPEASAVAPVIAELKLSHDQVAKLSALRDQLQEQQSAAWAAESAAAFSTPAGRQDIRDAQTAIARFGSPALRAVLNSSGLGNHPELVRFAAKALRSNSFRNC